MAKRLFNPQGTFETDLDFLAKLDPTIPNEVQEVIQLLLDIGELPEEFKDHPLTKNWTGFREFHVRDTLKGESPSPINDIVLIYKWRKNKLVLVAVRLGSHDKLFTGKFKEEN